jgi:hypothetical protein
MLGGYGWSSGVLWAVFQTMLVALGIIKKSFEAGFEMVK